MSNAADTAQKRVQLQQLPLSKETSQEFYFSTNMAEINLQPGDKLQYYFQVWDNDAIHGPKTATSQTFEIDVPTENELDNMLSKNMDQIESKAESSINELKKLQQDINELMQRLVDKKDLNWQDKQQLQQLADKQRQVKERLQKMQEQIKENNKLEQRLSRTGNEIMQKQKELDKLMDKVLTEEMKQMMNEMDRLMQQMDKKKMQEQLEQMKVKNEDLEKQLDQNIELMKRLELEKKVEDAVRKAENMADRQKELAKESKEAKGKDKEQQLKKQEALSQEFKELQKDLKEIQDDYKKLDNAEQFDVDKKLQQSIEQHQQSAEEQLQKGKNSQAGDQQQKAGEEMQQLSEKIEEKQQQLEQQSLAEDSEQIRRLLKNLVQLSFNQEDLMGNVKNVYIQDPKYQQIYSRQKQDKTDFRNATILVVHCKRQINGGLGYPKELGTANENIAKSLRRPVVFQPNILRTGAYSQAATSMQYTMTSLKQPVADDGRNRWIRCRTRCVRTRKAPSATNPTGAKRTRASAVIPAAAKPSPSMKRCRTH